jgi:hypothetical protein
MPIPCRTSKAIIDLIVEVLGGEGRRVNGPEARVGGANAMLFNQLHWLLLSPPTRAQAIHAYASQYPRTF